jgi:Ran-interacting Mog1 protein
MPATTYRPTPLFGGALHAQIPSSFIDVSALRQVPDHQEVFVQHDGFASIMFDVLERVDAASDEDAVKFHFDDLAGAEVQRRVIGVERARMDRMG